MSPLRKVSIRFRLIAGFLAAAVLLVVISTIQFVGSQRVNTSIHDVVEERQPRAFALKTLNATLRDAASRLGFFSATGEPSMAEGFAEQTQLLQQQLDRQLAMSEGDAQARQALQQVAKQVARFHEIGERIIALRDDQEANYPGVAYANAHINPLTTRMTQQAAGLIQSEVADGEADATQAQRLAIYSDLRDALSNMMRALRGYLAFRTDSQKNNANTYLEQAQNLLEQVSTWQEKFTFEQEEYVGQLRQELAEAKGHLQKMFELHGSPSWRTDSWMLRRDMLPLLAEIEKRLNALGDSEQQRIDAVSTELLDQADSATALSISVTVLGLLAGVLVAGLITRSIIRPIHQASTAMERVAQGEGDLTARLDEDGHDELSRLAQNFNVFVGYIQTVIGQTAKTTSAVIGGVASTNEAVDRIAERIVSQQQETDQMAAAITEMSASVAEVAHSASDADDAARSALEEAQQGRSTVSDTANGIQGLAERLSGASELMQRLDGDAQSIRGVVDVIRGVAEQTNLLALNAAIEAARAGESGRGFAVVADEVRTLANRTHESTVEIEDMISRLAGSASDAVELMSHGRDMADSNAKQAHHAITALTSIESAVRTISELNGQIAISVEQQRAVSKNIHDAAEHVSVAGRDNAEEAARARDTAGQLGDLISDLQSLVSRFKIDSAELDFENAINAHLAWRARVRNFLDGRGSMQKQEVVSHHDCTLGKWYYSEGLEKYADFEEMQALEAPHARLHAIIGEILGCKERGELNQAEQLFEELSELSDSIVSLLENLRAKLTAGASPVQHHSQG
jgi:methyl-accepting chemotaxis protein